MVGTGVDHPASLLTLGSVPLSPRIPVRGPEGSASIFAASTIPATSELVRKKPRHRYQESCQKRKCVSTACVACRRRKSKCDGAMPSCAACTGVYRTECVYDPNSDHRRKGVYRRKVDSTKTGNSALQILIEAILNATEEEAITIVKRIRTCDSLDTLADDILKQEAGEETDDHDEGNCKASGGLSVGVERDLACKMGELRVENGTMRYFGGTSHLLYHDGSCKRSNVERQGEEYVAESHSITAWTQVTDDPLLITFLLNKYFHYHYPYFATLSKTMFFRDFFNGRALSEPGDTIYCSPLLVNAMLALGCHFTDIFDAYGTPGDNRTKGDHFFAEAKRLIIENNEYEGPCLVNVQALALMSVREAGCAREASGWVYSGVSFRMAQDIGLNLEVGVPNANGLNEHEIDARRMTFWGCFLFDKCWSNYLGRLPLLPRNSFNVPKMDVFPEEDAELWQPFTDTGLADHFAQPSRTRAVALQMSKLCEISSDLMTAFYHPQHIGRSLSKTAGLKKLSELHQRLEKWHQELPKEFAPKEGTLPHVILMLMFFHLQYIHLFRPFLKYTLGTSSPLPAHISPRRICTANAGAISKLMRLYKRTWNLRQICNIAVYLIHSACTIHLLNLPEKTAKRDIVHGVKHLEEMSEDWLCARRTLSILSVLARKWKCVLPDEAALVLQNADIRYGCYSPSAVPSPQPQPGDPSASDNAHQRQGVGPLTRSDQAYIAEKSCSDSVVNFPMTMGSTMELGRNAKSASDERVIQDTSFDLTSWKSSHQVTTSSQQACTTSDDHDHIDGLGNQTVLGADASEWFLSDSARWQQSFSSWNSSAGHASNGQPTLMFGHVNGGNADNLSFSATTAVAMVTTQTTQQHSVGEDVTELQGFEGFGWLADLD